MQKLYTLMTRTAISIQLHPWKERHVLESPIVVVFGAFRSVSRCQLARIEGNAIASAFWQSARATSAWPPRGPVRTGLQQLGWTPAKSERMAPQYCGSDIEGDHRRPAELL